MSVARDVPQGWFKVPKLRRRRKPLPAETSGDQWSARHHVTASKNNVLHMKHHRVYFDAVPNIRLSSKGGYEDLELRQPTEAEDPDGHASRLIKRFSQFPSTASEMSTGKWKAKAPRMLSALIPGASKEIKSKSSHSYSFPSWSDRGRAHYKEASVVLSHRAGSSAGSLVDEATELPMAAMGSTRASQAARAGPRHSGLSNALLTSLSPGQGCQIKAFQEWCEKRFGHMVALWRKLDDDGNMTLSKAEFLKGLKDLNYPGKVSALWCILDADATGLITFNEFVPVDALHLSKFKHWADEKFGSVVNAFRFFDDDHNGKMSMQEFADGCQAADFPASLKNSVQALFDVMDDSKGQGKALITADEMAFLDAWKCPEYLWVHPDEKAKKAFEEALIARHGHNYIIAWRKALDKDHNWRVTFPEFIATCKRLAKLGIPQAAPANGAAALFCAFDHHRRGWFTLHDWHEDSWNLLYKFNEWVHREFTKMADFYKSCDVHAVASGVSLGNFRAHTRDLDCSSEEKEYLFEGLSLQTEAWSEEKHRYAHGTMSKGELLFLDQWHAEEDEREANAWDEQFRSATPSAASEDLDNP